MLPPAVGSWASYEGDDGSILNISVEGNAQIVDPWLTPVDVLMVRYVYQASGARESHVLFEAIHTGTGSAVAQLNMCGGATNEDEVSPWGGCVSDRFLYVGGVYGIPAFFGLAPLWLETARSTVAWPGSGMDGELEDFSYAVGPKGSCLELSRPATLEDVNLRGLWFTFIEGPTVVCGKPFPESFTTSTLPVFSPSYGKTDTVTYQLQNHQAGASSPPIAQPLPPSTAKAVSLAKPLYSTGIVEDVAFPASQAHAWAMENVSQYRSIIDGGGMVAGYAHLADGWTDVHGVHRNDQFEGTLTAVAPDGTGLEVVLRKTKSSTLTLEVDSIDLVEQRDVRVAWPVSLPAESATIAMAREQVGQIHDLTTEVFHAVGFRTHKGDLGAGPSFFGSRLDHRQQGVDLYLHYTPTEVGFVTNPHAATIDGPTGGMVVVAAPYSSLHAAVEPAPRP